MPALPPQLASWWKQWLHVNNSASFFADCYKAPANAPETNQVIDSCKGLAFRLDNLHRNGNLKADERKAISDLWIEVNERICALGVLEGCIPYASFVAESHPSGVAEAVRILESPEFASVPSDQREWRDATERGIRERATKNAEVTKPNPTVPLLPLANVPPALEDRITNDKVRDSHHYGVTTRKGILQEVFADCRAAPDQDHPREKVAHGCESVSDSVAFLLNVDGAQGDLRRFLNPNADHDWVVQHGYLRAAEDLQLSAAKRSCALSSPDGCALYGRILLNANRKQEAQAVWSSPPCAESKYCLALLARSLRTPEEVKADNDADKAAKDAQERAYLDTLAAKYPQTEKSHTATDILNAINQGLGAVSDTLEQHNQEQAARNDAQMQQAQAQVAANDARREAQAERARQFSQQATAQRQTSIPAGCNNTNQACKATGNPPLSVTQNQTTASLNPTPQVRPAASSSGTGTVAPPSCVYLSPSACVPIAQYQQWQSGINAAASSITGPNSCGGSTPWPKVVTLVTDYNIPIAPNTYLCPRSGSIATGHWKTTDVWEGENLSCTPGTPLSITFGSDPLCISANSSSFTGNSSGSGSGVQTTAPLTNCVTPTYVNDDLTYVNSCNVPVYVQYFIGTYSGSWTLDPIGNGNTNGTGFSSSQVAAAGGDHFYVCPKNYDPVDPNGHPLTRPVNSYHCATNQ
jgi:hypothetical protein